MTSVAAYGEGVEKVRSGDQLDLGALWHAIQRRKTWLVLPALVALVGTTVAVNLITPRYTGEARILLEMRDGYYTRPSGDREGAGGGQPIDVDAVGSQVQVMMSRDLARSVIKRVGLVGNDEFDPGVGMFNALKRLLVILGVVNHPADRSPEDRVLEKYYDRLTVYPVTKSRIVAVEFTSKDPALAAKGANAVAETYLVTQEGAKKDTARSASAWLSSTIDPLRKKVAESEARVEEYRSRAGLQTGTNNTLIASQQLTDLSSQIATARTTQADSQAKARLLKDALKNGRMFEVPDVANNDLVRRLIEQRVNLRAQLALESRTLLSEHPRIKELSAQLADLENQIRVTAERTVRALENEARIAGARVESLTAAMDAQRRAVGEANEAEVQLRALEREAKTQREQLEQYMTRYREAIARDADNATPADARIVSRAIEPTTPSFPKKLPTIIVATLATFFVSLAVAASRAMMSGDAHVPGRRSTAGEEDYPEPDAPAGGAAQGEESAVGEVDAAEADTTQPGPRPRAADPRQEAKVAGLLAHTGRAEQIVFEPADMAGFRADLADWLGDRPAGATPCLLSVDAAGPGGLRAVDIARELAENEHVVLVDLTDASPLWAQGLSELISGDAGIGEVIDREAGSRLHVIGAGRAGVRPVLAAPELVGLMIQALAQTYDRVMLAVSAPREAAVLADLLRQSDGALVVGGEVGNGHAVEIAYRLAEMAQKPVGVVIGAPVRLPGQSLRDSEFADV